MKRNIIIFASVVLLIATAAHAFKLPDTGQTKCYRDVSPYDEIPCAGTGQDGAYNINPMSFTDHGNGTVTDNNTGLMWQKCSVGQNNDETCSGTAVTYNWYRASGTYHPTYNPESQDVCGSLNLGGYSDWRLPAKKELITIVDYSIPYPGPTINTTYFPNTKSSGYWSSTTSARSPDDAWYVYFDSGYVYYHDKGYSPYVRCVRGGQYPEQNLIDNKDGTVTDNATGLVWQQGEPGGMTWGSAISYCEGLSLGGNTDLRLPNIKELESITDDTRWYPAIDTTFFPGAYASRYWSSTTDAYYPYGAWGVNFDSGSVFSYPKYSSYCVRCVRGGQFGSFGDLVISPDSYDFGNVNVGATSPARTFTASNTGTANLEIYTITITGPDSSEFSIQNDYCSGTILAPSGNCTVQAVFSPTSSGLKSANMSIPSNDPDTPVLDVPLSGTGIADVAGCVDLDGSPLKNKKVMLKQTGEVNQTTTTDSGGCYGFVDAVSGKTFTVQINGPVLSSPVPVIHGCADLQGSPMSGRKVLLKQKNETNKSTKTGADGCYSFTNAVPDKNFKVLIKGPVVP